MSVIYIRPKTVFVPFQNVRGVELREAVLPLFAHIDEVRVFMFGKDRVGGDPRLKGRKISYVESDDAKDINEYMARRNQDVSRTRSVHTSRTN